MDLIQDKVKKLMEAKDHYYNGEPIMTDEEFDKLEDELRQIDPTNPYFDLVGVTVTREKVKHDIPMISCNKTKTIDGLISWIEKMNIVEQDLVIEPKIDGVSCSIIYDNCVLKRVATRGDGLVGQDISHLCEFMNVPMIIDAKGEIEVRGEIYLPKNTKFPNSDNKPLRSLASGLVNRKDLNLEDLSFLKFIPYQLYGSSLARENRKLSLLKRMRFTELPYYIATNIASKINEIKMYYNEYLERLRDQWEFETDGLVFVVNDNDLWDELDSKYVATNHHYYNIALKPPAISKETILEGIEWNVSRFGKIIPTAILKPIVIGGSTISRCSLSNVENIETLNLASGDVVEIERANDVIPYLKKVQPSNSTSILIPSKCPSCNNLLSREGPHLVCNYDLCQERVIMQILHWIQTCEMDGLSESFARKLVGAKRISCVEDLYQLNEKDFEGIDGFASKKIKTALDQIEKSRRMSIRQFLQRLGINGVGKKAIEKLNINTIDEIFTFKSDHSFIGHSLESFVNSNKSFIYALLRVLKVHDEPQLNSSPLAKVCMTGTGPKGRKDLINEITKMSYLFVDNINKDTNILVCEDINGNSSKLQKARKLGVKIVSYEEFFGSK